MECDQSIDYTHVKMSQEQYYFIQLVFATKLGGKKNLVTSGWAGDNSSIIEYLRP